MTPLPRARPSALTATRPWRSRAHAFAGAGSVKTSKSAVGIAARRISALAKTLLDSMRPARRLGPKTGKPASRSASPTPASTAASGPSTMRPSCSRFAKLTRRTTSATPIAMLRAMPPVPPLPRAPSRSARSPVSGLAVVFDQAPDGCERFMKRGVMGIRILIAVPSAIRPLRPEQHLGQMPDPEALRHTQVAAHRKRIALHRCVASFPAGDDERLRRRRDPVQHRPCCGAGGTVSARHAQLDERHEAPVGSCPLGVGMHPKASVGSLTGQKLIDHRLPPGRVEAELGYSHSMVPGGFDVMSNTTLLTPLTSLTMRLLMRARTS